MISLEPPAWLESTRYAAASANQNVLVSKTSTFE